MSVCPGMRVEDPDVKKCPFKSTTPQCMYVGVGVGVDVTLRAFVGVCM